MKKLTRTLAATVASIGLAAAVTSCGSPVTKSAHYEVLAKYGVDLKGAGQPFVVQGQLRGAPTPNYIYGSCTANDAGDNLTPCVYFVTIQKKVYVFAGRTKELAAGDFKSLSKGSPKAKLHIDVAKTQPEPLPKDHLNLAVDLIP